MASVPSDGYAAYFAEKLWALVPPYHRDEDAKGENPGVLRAIVELWAQQAAILRRDLDRLWDDSFIDLCDSWAVPYLGDLVATRMVSALDARARRIDVAKTIYYRRRAGTLRVLEELIGDITRWDGVVVEEFRRLARAPHGLEPAPELHRGRFTGTPPGGLPDLRAPLGASLVGGPFDEYSYTPDFRRSRGRDGRVNIPKLGFHLYRLLPLQMVLSTPRRRAATLTFTFDPSGREAPLFGNRKLLADWDTWRSALPWELPAPIACRMLNQADFIVDDDAIAALRPVLVAAGHAADDSKDLLVLRGARFEGEARFVKQLKQLTHAASFTDPAVLPRLLDLVLAADCGKSGLLPSAISVVPAGAAAQVPPGLTAGADLSTWATSAPGRKLLIDPARGRVQLLSGAPADQVTVSYTYGFTAAIGAGPYDRRASLVAPTLVQKGGGALPALPDTGAIEIGDSATYSSISGSATLVDLTLQAGNLQRPFVEVGAGLALGGKPGAKLVIDGLWLGRAGAAASLKLQGNFAQVVLRHLTLDPGGTDVDGAAIFPLSIVVEGQIQELLIESSILAGLSVTPAGVVDKLTIRDSILQHKGQALLSPRGETRLERVTVLGSLKAERLWVSDSIIAGMVNAIDTQDGCFRFSAAAPGSRLPHPFESRELTSVAVLFVSRIFGQPGYCQLSDAAPAGIARGAESGSEMGAFSALNNPIAADSLAAKVTEFIPFGLIPDFLHET